MTTKVTKNIPPQDTNLHRSVTHHKPPPQWSMCQSTSSNISSPAEISISHKHLPAIPLSPAAVVSRLGTWSDSAPEETYTSYTSAKDYNQ